MSGPFIVTLRRECRTCDGSGSASYVPATEPADCIRCEGEPTTVLAREAVADFESAQDFLAAAKPEPKSYEAGMETDEACDEIGPEGGKVSLPDGSEVEVEATTYERLADEADHYPVPWSRESILEVWLVECGVGERHGEGAGT